MSVMPAIVSMVQLDGAINPLNSFASNGEERLSRAAQPNGADANMTSQNGHLRRDLANRAALALLCLSHASQ
jgi:hypothetical protein